MTLPFWIRTPNEGISFHHRGFTPDRQISCNDQKPCCNTDDPHAIIFSNSLRHLCIGSATAQVAGTDEIRFWIMTWGSKAEVLEPESLREEIRAEAEKMATRRYQTPIITAVSPPYGQTRKHPN